LPEARTPENESPAALTTRTGQRQMEWTLPTIGAPRRQLIVGAALDLIREG
jgi:hypothetical protein